MCRLSLRQGLQLAHIHWPKRRHILWPQGTEAEKQHPRIGDDTRAYLTARQLRVLKGTTQYLAVTVIDNKHDASKAVLGNVRRPPCQL